MINRLRNLNRNGASTSQGETPDAELVRVARRGDKKAFVEIVARHQAMVCGIALGILKDFAASEDAAQEAFLTAWRKFQELREPDRLRSWLGQIARNTALGHLRRSKGYDPLDDELTLEDDSPLPDETAANREEAALVSASLAKLPEAYRLPLILYYRESQSVRAVAETLDISEDAVKQRLARGREMLRNRMAGLVETVLTRTKPNAVFTMTIAMAIGALAAPAAIAGTVFAATATAASTASASSSTSSIIAAMTTSKPFLVTTALVVAVCVPVGYHVRTEPAPQPKVNLAPAPVVVEEPEPIKKSPSYEESVLFAQWRELHEEYGTTAEAMPQLYKAISDIKDSVRRRSFRAALIAEWVQVDPGGGMDFFIKSGMSSKQRRQFLEEWLAIDPEAAVQRLLASGKGWEKMARVSLEKIAQLAPGHLGEIATRLPKSDNYWDRTVEKAFTAAASADLEAGRKLAESVEGPNRTQALAGVASAWGQRDFDGALEWAKSFSEGVDQSELIRLALMGKAQVDPIAALNSVSLVPSGGKESHFGTTTGARVLREAAKTDFEATIAWIAENPTRLNGSDLDGISRAVTDRLNADPHGFLSSRLDDGSLKGLLPAISSALLNGSSGHQSTVWDWLQTQPMDEATEFLRKRVISSAGYQNPELAISLVDDLPPTPQGDKDIETIARSLWNGGQAFHRFDDLMNKAPERLQGALVESAFGSLSHHNFHEPEQWIDRLQLLPETSQANGVKSIARAWAADYPEEAVDWVSRLEPGDARTDAMTSATAVWASRDPHSAAEWVGGMQPGLERDRTTGGLVNAMSRKYPGEAWEWAMSIDSAEERNKAAAQAARMMAKQDPETAGRWVETGPFTPATRAELQAELGSDGPR